MNHTTDKLVDADVKDAETTQSQRMSTSETCDIANMDQGRT